MREHRVLPNERRTKQKRPVMATRIEVSVDITTDLEEFLHYFKSIGWKVIHVGNRKRNHKIVVTLEKNILGMS
jgi:hypothetical protein